MKSEILEKAFKEYPDTREQEQLIIDGLFSDGKDGWNVHAIKLRLRDNCEIEARDLFVMNGNEFVSINKIVARVRVMKKYEILTDEQWEHAMPIIEMGIEANYAYKNMINEMAPILDRYCKKFVDVNMRYTFMSRVKLECWQGMFSSRFSRSI